MANDRDALEVILEGTVSLVHWVKATVRSVYLEKRDYPSPSRNAKWNTPGEAADMLHAQVVWDWLYDDHRIHPLNTSIT